VTALAADRREPGGLVGWVLDVTEALGAVAVLPGVVVARRVRRRRAGLDLVTGEPH
jgi:hypothetical protein